MLTVAGSPKEIKMTVKLTSLGNGKYKIEGNKEVLMTDFGVKPPTAIMGLLKARDRLTFYFDIIVNG
jgi:polyisoprenoid-binding protein YceI